MNSSSTASPGSLGTDPVCAPPLPLGPYTVLYADPPWAYRDPAHAGRRGACYQYPVMDTPAIGALPVGAIAAGDAALFLWTTPPQMPAALEVMTAWGFTYKTFAFVWVKTSAHGRLAWGMGNWPPAAPERCRASGRAGAAPRAQPQAR